MPPHQPENRHRVTLLALALAVTLGAMMDAAALLLTRIAPPALT